MENFLKGKKLKASDLPIYEIIEHVQIPYLLVNKKAIRFTNICFVNKGSGDEIFLVVTPKGKYLFLEVGYEPDCDGSYYWNRFIDEIEYDDYDMNNSLYFNGVELSKLLHIL